MRKTLVLWLTLAPLAAAAAGLSRDGSGFDAGGPPAGPGPEAPADPAELRDRGLLAREKAAYAADLLYPAAEKVFDLVKEVTLIPALTCPWNEVGADGAAEEEGGNPRQTYLREFESRRATLAAAWKKKDTRNAILARWREERATIIGAQEDIKAAVEISKAAGKELHDVVADLHDLEDMAMGRPGMGGGRPDAAKMPSALDVRAMESGAKDADNQAKAGKDLLKKIEKSL